LLLKEARVRVHSDKEKAWKLLDLKTRTETGDMLRKAVDYRTCSEDSTRTKIKTQGVKTLEIHTRLLGS